MQSSIHREGEVAEVGGEQRYAGGSCAEKHTGISRHGLDRGKLIPTYVEHNLSIDVH